MVTEAEVSDYIERAHAGSNMPNPRWSRDVYRELLEDGQVECVERALAGGEQPVDLAAREAARRPAPGVVEPAQEGEHRVGEPALELVEDLEP